MPNSRASVFYQPISGFTLGGVPITARSLNRVNSLYPSVSATGTIIGGVTSYSSRNISLMADFGDNDGTPTVTTGSPGSPETIPASNSAGVADDIVQARSSHMRLRAEGRLQWL